jgi:hypothetical protein
MVFYSMCVLSRVNYDFLIFDVVLLSVCSREHRVVIYILMFIFRLCTNLVTFHRNRIDLVSCFAF